MAMDVKFRSTEKKRLQYCEYNSSVWGYFQVTRFSTWGLTISRKQDASEPEREKHRGKKMFSTDFLDTSAIVSYVSSGGVKLS